MNSIIKHINYEQFTQILGEASLNQFLKNSSGYRCIFFIAEWSIPSRLTFKRIKKICFNKKNIAFVDVDIADNIQLCEKYNVTKVPHSIVMSNQKIQFQIVGLNIERLNEALLKFNVIQQTNKQPPKTCPKNHVFKCLTSLPYPPYTDSYFFCNRCRKVDQCHQKAPVLHCDECDYDMCKFCQLGLNG